MAGPAPPPGTCVVLGGMESQSGTRYSLPGPEWHTVQGGVTTGRGFVGSGAAVVNGASVHCSWGMTVAGVGPCCRGLQPGRRSMSIIEVGFGE